MAKASDGKNNSSARSSRGKKTANVDSGKRILPVPPSVFKSNGDVEERIRQRAYELYEQEGRQEGRDQEYWLRAEAEILGRRSA